MAALYSDKEIIIESELSRSLGVFNPYEEEVVKDMGYDVFNRLLESFGEKVADPLKVLLAGVGVAEVGEIAEGSDGAGLTPARALSAETRNARPSLLSGSIASTALARS